MALVDLISDLSKFRSEVSKEPKSSPEASKATNNKNFATLQPISAKLSQFGTPVKEQQPKQLETKLGSTKLDDIRKIPLDGVLINSVSKYSSINENFNQRGFDNSRLATITSKFDDIRQDRFVSRLTSSEILITKQTPGTNNLVSTVNPNIVDGDTTDNITNPNIDVIRPLQSFDREKTSPNIVVNRNEPSDNIQNPNTPVERPVQSFDRTKQSVVINKDLVSPLNNVINPNVALERSTFTFDRVGQSPNIITDTIKEGLVTNPDTKVFRIEQGTYHFVDESQLNIDINPIRFVTTSRLAEFQSPREPNTEKYVGESIQTEDNSLLNVDTVIRTNPVGRHENPEKSRLTIIGKQQVNFFPDSQVKGFIVNTQPGITSFTGNSNFSWIGGKNNAPETNFIDDVNARGFKKFAQIGQTEYNVNSSVLGFSSILETDFFDVTKNYVSSGFKSFVVNFETAYKSDASIFTWSGKRDQAPETNFFDVNNAITSTGFHKFAQIFDSKYVPDSSQFGWRGIGGSSPETNFFDLSGINTSIGFNRFAQIFDSKYIPGSSIFDWDGNSTNAPETNFFDVSGVNSNSGFHKFAQIFDSKYVPDSSQFDWDGSRTSAPETNFFDINGTNSSVGFHKFAQIFDSKYVPDSSQFDWDGARDNAPEVNYFDLSGLNSNAGFHKFAQVYDTKFIADSSQFDWDGARDNAPEANFFDIAGSNSSVGFHKFAQLYDSKYLTDSSQFNWDGARDDAPEVNYFDLSGTNSSIGFHKFAQLYDTKYVAESSQFDWDGGRDNAPEVNYFDLSATNTTTGFHKFAGLYDSKYVMESSQYNWDGDRQQAPEVNYFDIQSSNATGFTKFAQLYDTKYVAESSQFDWDGSSQDAPEVNYFDLSVQHTTTGFHKFAQLYDTKFIRDSSIFDWDGNSGQQSPEVDEFDLTRSSATKGFERIPPSMITRYVRDASRFTFEGSNQSAPEIDTLDKTRKYAVKGFEKFPQRMITKYVKDASEYDFNGPSRSAPKTNFFPDTKGKGFTAFAEKLNSEYSKDVSEFTFKGGLPKEINFFPDTNGSGFTNKTPLLDSKFEHESSEFAFKGSTPDPVDFLSNTNGTGFDVKVDNETKFVKDSSQFVFKGNPRSADTANFFEDTNSTGFTSFPEKLTSEFVGKSSFEIVGDAKQDQELNNNGQPISSRVESKLAEKDSGFGWKGARDKAPEVDFFKITGNAQDGIIGFTRLFDNTETKLSDEFSRFSFASATRISKITNSPVTTFFGYTPSERTGFMAGMNTGDATLYPIIDPVLTFDEMPSRRFEIESARARGRSLKTVNREKYAPLSLGKRPWANGTLSATLENQVPNTTTGAPAGSYENTYERGVKDNTEQKGYLTKWAITRRSPSPLDQQYSKFNLRNDAFNRDLIWSQPFVLRGIQGGLEPERWGGVLSLVDEGISRGGIAVQAERILFDVQRIGKFLTSVRGLAWNAKQIALQLMNPNVDIDPKVETSNFAGKSATQIYNPLSLPVNLASARAGFHAARHGGIFTNSEYLNKYEKATLNRETNITYRGDEDFRSFDNLEAPTVSNRDPGGYNRLIGLMKELLPNSFKQIVSTTQTNAVSDQERQGTSTEGTQGGSSAASSISTFIFGNPETRSEIYRISSDNGGPQSPAGIGPTTIRRASHPYLVNYTTTPILSGDNQPAYTPESKRETYYAQSVSYGSYVKNTPNFGGLLKALSYALFNGPKELNDVSTDGGALEIQPAQLSIIQEKNTFDPRHDTLFSRAERVKEGTVGKTGTGLAGFVHPDNVDKDSLVKQYRTANYDKLRRNQRPGNRFFNDFRADVGVDFSNRSGAEDAGRSFMTNPNIARFGTRNLSERYGFGDQGRPGVRRDQPFVSSIRYAKFDNPEVIQQNGNKEFRDYGVPIQKDGQYFRGDRINIIDYKRANFNINTGLAYELGNTTLAETGVNGTRDLIEFYFSSLVLQGHDNCPAEIIVFRATFGNITDNHKPSWNSVKYMGRADPLYVYQGYEREISFDFKVHIGSRDEMRASWRKLNYLASWTAPEYRDNGFMRGPMIRLNIGHLYRKMPGYISSLSYTFDNTQTTWETAKLPEDMNFSDAEIKKLSSPGVLQLPKHVDVNVSFVPVGVYRPEFRGVMYSLYDDTTTGRNVETGLIPHNSPNRVNYFIEYETDGSPVIYSGYDNGKPYAANPIQTITLEPDPSNPDPVSKGNTASGSSAAPGAPVSGSTELTGSIQQSGSLANGIPAVSGSTTLNPNGIPVSGSASTSGSATQAGDSGDKTKSQIPRPPDGEIPPALYASDWATITQEEENAYNFIWTYKNSTNKTFRKQVEAIRNFALNGYAGIPPGKAAAVKYMRDTFGVHKKSGGANVPGYKDY